MRPSPSGRVALTETRSLATPRAAPNDRRISSRAGAIDGRSATIVRSAETGLRARVPNHPDDAAEQVEPADPREGRVGVGEVLPDVPERERPEHRVRERVTHHVAVRMPREPLPLEADPPQQQGTPRRERVHVEPRPISGSVTGRAPPRAGRRPPS